MKETYEKLAVIRAKDMISLPSETPYDLQESKRKEKFKFCEEVLDYLEDSFLGLGAKTQRFVFEGSHDKWAYPVPNLYSEVHIGDTSAKDTKFICYMGHIDVVPVGDENLWKHKPFSGKEQDGYVWGRGATDMKGSVASWSSAVEEIVREKDVGTNLIIGSIITADEEWAGINGTDKVLQWMASQGRKPDSFIVGEPSSADYLGSHIKVGRRGSLGGYLTAKGVQGHRAYDDLYNNPNRALAYAMTILNAKRWKDGNKYFPNTTFENVATKSGDFNASAIIPEEAKALWNIRFTSKQDKFALAKEVEEAIKNPPAWLKKHPDYAKLANVTIQANLDTASMPYYSEPKGLALSAKKAINDILRLDAAFDGSGGTTDGRFVQKYFPHAQIIELGVPENGGVIKGVAPSDYKKRGGMHQIDERVSVEDLQKLQNLYVSTVKNYVTKKGR